MKKRKRNPVTLAPKSGDTVRIKSSGEIGHVVDVEPEGVVVKIKGSIVRQKLYHFQDIVVISRFDRSVGRFGY